MAGNRIVNISKNNLPIDADTNEYIFRYRVVSDDKNRFSAWSPTYRLQAPTISQTLENNGITAITKPTFAIQTVGLDKVLNVYWNILDVFRDIDKYDVYLDWGNGYEYFNTMPAGSFSIVKPADKAGILATGLKIQSVTYPKKLLDSQVLYTLDSTKDSFSF